jgi:homoserine O-acetyltransferase
MDPTWKQKDPAAGLNGMKTARGIALISYRNQETYNFYQEDTDMNSLGPYKSESYQIYQGEKLASRFNAFSYYFLSKSMDSHQVGRGRLGISAALIKIKAKTHLIGIQSDLLFTGKEQVFLLENIPGAFLYMIPSLYGHDGFLLEYDAISGIMNDFLQKENVSPLTTVYTVN